MIRSRRAIPYFVLTGVTLATFAPVLFNEFVIYDDASWLAENPHLNPPSIENWLYFWQHPFEGLYVPVTFTYWTLLAVSGGMRAGVMHGGNILLHMASTVLVYQILLPLVRRRVAAGAGALLFAVHPLQVESVAWASGGKDLLAGLLSLAVIWEYLRYAAAKSPAAARGAHYALAMLALIAGMLAKPSAVVAPFIAGLIELRLIRRDVRKVSLSLLPMLVLVVPCLIWARNIQTAWSDTVPPLWMRPMIAADALAFYLYKLVWPTPLTVFYGRTPQAVQQSGAVYITWILPAVVLALLAYTRRRLPGVVLGAAIFVLALLPVLGLTPFMFQLYSTVADHYAYLAMFGASLALAYVVMIRATRPVYWVVGLIILALAVRSALQIRYWRDSVALFAHAVEVTPDNQAALGNFGLALEKDGRPAEAAEQYRKMLARDRGNPAILGLLRRAEAAAEAARLDPPTTKQ